MNGMRQINKFTSVSLSNAKVMFSLKITSIYRRFVLRTLQLLYICVFRNETESEPCVVNFDVGLLCIGR